MHCEIPNATGTGRRALISFKIRAAHHHCLAKYVIGRGFVTEPQRNRIPAYCALRKHAREVARCQVVPLCVRDSPGTSNPVWGGSSYARSPPDSGRETAPRPERAEMEGVQPVPTVAPPMFAAVSCFTGLLLTHFFFLLRFVEARIRRLGSPCGRKVHGRLIPFSPLRRKREISRVNSCLGCCGLRTRAHI